MATLDLLRKRVEARRALPAPPLRRAIRKAAGSSLEALAEALGVSRETVRLWELGEHEPYVHNLRTYSEALEILEAGRGVQGRSGEVNANEPERPARRRRALGGGDA